jgi:Alginate export
MNSFEKAKVRVSKNNQVTNKRSFFMRKLLSAVVLAAMVPTVHAQDKGKADISLNGEYRARYWWMQNPGANKKSQSTDSSVTGRGKIGVNMKASEDVSAVATLIHSARFGQGKEAGETVGRNDYATSTTTNGGPDENALMVNEFYGVWRMSDDMYMKVGRMGYQIGDGKVIGINDFEATPYSFEGLLAGYELEFGKFQFFAFKHKELGEGSAAKDAEHNAYGLNFDLKTKPEMIKSLNVHVIKDAANAVADSTGTTIQGEQGQDLLRYGIDGHFTFSIVDLGLGYFAYTGKNKEVTGAGVKTERDAEGSMIHAEVGVNFAEFMGSRAFFRYHQDSGDKANSTKEDGTYDAYFYEKDMAAGALNLLGYGNLTAMTVGYTLKPMEKTTVGVMYHMFSKTEKGTEITKGENGQNFSATAAKEDIGQEIDVVAEHHYESGFSTAARLGYFMPGDALKDATTKMEDAIVGLMLQGKMTF